MIWKVKKDQDIMWYTSDVCQMKLKEVENKINIWLNYKGYNIIMPMGMWGFDEEVSERGINIGGDSMSAWYFIIEKNALRLFVDLVYFFIKEHNCDKMINTKLLIEDWS